MMNIIDIMQLIDWITDPYYRDAECWFICFWQRVLIDNRMGIGVDYWVDFCGGSNCCCIVTLHSWYTDIHLWFVTVVDVAIGGIDKSIEYHIPSTVVMLLICDLLSIMTIDTSQHRHQLAAYAATSATHSNPRHKLVFESPFGMMSCCRRHQLPAA